MVFSPPRTHPPEDGGAPRHVWRRGRWTVLSLPLIGFLLIPLVALLIRTSPAALGENLGQPEVTQAIVLSLKTSLLATLATVLLGTPVALLMARRQFRFQRALDTLIDLPMVLPPAVAGVALLMAFGRGGLIGSVLADWGLQVTFTPVAVVMAQAFVAAPLYVRSAIIGFSGIEPELEDAALLDGASTWQVVRYVTLPLARSALIGGAVLTWARALGEFGATIIFAGNLPGRTQTMPLAIYIGFELDLGMALTLSAILMGISFVALILIRYFLL